MEDLLTLEKIAYRIDEQTIVSDIDLSIAKGKRMTIVGPSGSGKSTVLQLIARMITATSGTMTFAGQDAFSYEPTAYRRRVSYCFQQPTLFGTTVADNLNFPFDIRDQSVDSKRQLDLLDQVNLPTSYLDHEITELSGGERQRVALIRNLIFPPDILLLDEVTTGLDADNKAIVHELIDHFQQRGGTVIAVTHDDSEIAQADVLYRIEKGHHVQEATHA